MPNLDFTFGGPPSLTRVLSKEEVLARLLARGAPANTKPGPAPRDPGPAAPAARRPAARTKLSLVSRPAAGGQAASDAVRNNRLKSAALRAADQAIKRWDIDLARETRRVRQAKEKAEKILQRAKERADQAEIRLKAREADRKAMEEARTVRRMAAKREREARRERKAQDQLQAPARRRSDGLNDGGPRKPRVRPVTGRVNTAGLDGRARVLAQTTPKGSVIVSLAVAPDLFGSGLKVRDRVRVTIGPELITVVRCDPKATPSRPGRLSSDMWVNAYKANLRMSLGVASKLGLPPLRLTQSATLPVRPVEGGFAFARTDLSGLFDQAPIPVDLRLEGHTLLASRPVGIAAVRPGPDGSLSLEGVDVIEVQNKRPGVGTRFARKHDLSAWLTPRGVVVDHTLAIAATEAARSAADGRGDQDLGARPMPLAA